MSQSQRSRSGRSAYWQDLVDQWLRSGLSQAAFCREHRITYGSFTWWKRRLASASGGDAASRGSRGGRGCATETGSFVEVQLNSTRMSYEVVLPGDRVLRIYEPFDSESVSRLITAVEGAE